MNVHIYNSTLISTKWVVYTIPDQIVPKQQRCTRHDNVCKPKKQNNHISISSELTTDFCILAQDKVFDENGSVVCFHLLLSSSLPIASRTNASSSK